VHRSIYARVPAHSAASLAPLFTPLLEKMLLTYDARQRENAIGATRELVTKLSRKKKTTQSPK